jgi:AmiR/NasT family two-component response regulator
MYEPNCAEIDPVWVATGVLIQQRSCTADEAFEQLLAMAFRRDESVQDIAERIVVLASLGCVLEDDRS